MRPIVVGHDRAWSLQTEVSGSWPLWRSSSHPTRGRERLISADRRLCGPHAAGRPLAEILLIPGPESCTLPALSRSGLGAASMLVATTKQDCRESPVLERGP